jgi:hypothetical protein
MVLDYAGIVPGIAATVMGLLLMNEKIPKWKRGVVILLTAIAISAMTLSQWWTNWQKEQEKEERTAIREQLGKFQERGEKLINITLDENSQLPIIEFNKWNNEVEEYLRNLSPSYVVRFRSSAGIPMPPFFKYGASKLPLWSALTVRLARLDQFSSEIPR